jgi:hypothetical protein
MALVAGAMVAVHASAADDAGNAIAVIEATTRAQAALFRYVVGCALRTDQSADLIIENRRERLVGQLGLAPSFFSAPNTVDRHSVSACVLARTNYAGRHVAIRFRAARSVPPAQLTPRRPARDEAAFFGDLYAAPPRHFVCALGDGEDYERALRAAHRLCALPSDAPGRSMCGFEYLGPCSRGAFRRNGTDYFWTALVVSMPTS